MSPRPPCSSNFPAPQITVCHQGATRGLNWVMPPGDKKLWEAVNWAACHLSNSSFLSQHPQQCTDAGEGCNTSAEFILQICYFWLPSCALSDWDCCKASGWNGRKTCNRRKVKKMAVHVHITSINLSQSWWKVSEDDGEITPAACTLHHLDLISKLEVQHLR